MSGAWLGQNFQETLECGEEPPEWALGGRPSGHPSRSKLTEGRRAKFRGGVGGWGWRWQWNGASHKQWALFPMWPLRSSGARVLVLAGAQESDDAWLPESTPMSPRCPVVAALFARRDATLGLTFPSIDNIENQTVAISLSNSTFQNLILWGTNYVLVLQNKELSGRKK